MNKKKCKVCGIEFHACSSCGLQYGWEYEYCSDGCWEKSKDYIETKFIFTKIYNKLKLDSLHGDFIDKFSIADDDYNEYILANWIEELEG